MIDVTQGVPGVNAPAPTSFEAFYAFYISQHLHPKTRLSHVTGLSLAIATVVVGAVTGMWWILVLAPLFGYGLAIPSHYVWEGNRPATFGGGRAAWWSARSDFRQVARFYTGRLARDVAAVRAGLGLAPHQITLADAGLLPTPEPAAR